MPYDSLQAGRPTFYHTGRAENAETIDFEALILHVLQVSLATYNFAFTAF